MSELCRHPPREQETLALEEVRTFIDTSLPWSATLAASMLALTMVASALLHPDRKEEIARWLKGAQSEEDWSQSFISLFDALFGEKHLSFRCFLISAATSLISVILIWLLIAGLGDLRLRIAEQKSLLFILGIALSVNVLADYVSLLETRWLLGKMRRARSAISQAGLLFLDLAITTAIIWVAIIAYLNSPWHEGEIESFGEILGVFSIFSVIFYSTFLTSVWSWAYILSTWIMRLTQRVRKNLLAIDSAPVIVLGHILALVVFLTSLAISVPLQKDASNLSVADRALCQMFKGRVCLDVAALSGAQKFPLELILLACEGGLTAECVRRGQELSNAQPEDAVKLLAVACNAGNSLGCGILAFHYGYGNGVREDGDKMALLFKKSCDGGTIGSCSNLALMHIRGQGVTKNFGKGVELFKKSCAAGIGHACRFLGHFHITGALEKDVEKGISYLEKGCSAEPSSRACDYLADVILNAEGVKHDPEKAKNILVKSCQSGNYSACVDIAFKFDENKIPNAKETLSYFSFQCLNRKQSSECNISGLIHSKGIGTDSNPKSAARYYGLACDLDSEWGCNNLATLYSEGRGVVKDWEVSQKYYRKSCKLGLKDACDEVRQTN